MHLSYSYCCCLSVENLILVNMRKSTIVLPAINLCKLALSTGKYYLLIEPFIVLGAGAFQ